MRKVIVSIMVSLDGFFAGPKGDWSAAVLPIHTRITKCVRNPHAPVP